MPVTAASFCRRARSSSKRLVTSRIMAAMPSMWPSASFSGMIVNSTEICSPSLRMLGPKEIAMVVPTVAGAHHLPIPVPVTRALAFRDDQIQGLPHSLGLGEAEDPLRTGVPKPD